MDADRAAATTTTNDHDYNQVRGSGSSKAVNGEKVHKLENEVHKLQAEVTEMGKTVNEPTSNET